jgi:copper chaperone
MKVTTSPAARWIAAVWLIAASPSFCGASKPLALHASSVAQERLTTVHLDVAGMTCGGCAVAVRAAVKKLEGVKKATVSYEGHSAVVTYDSAKVELSRILEAIGDAGFRAKVAPTDPQG